MSGRSSGWLLSVCVATSLLANVSKAGVTLNEVQSVTTTGNISSAIYSSQYNLLFLRDSTTDIRVLNATTGAQVSLRNPSATGAFTDFTLSPSGRYLYVADYGGTNIGYDTPRYPSYVNRYDLQAGTWTSAQAPAIGYRVAAVDDDRVLLLGVDQWVDLTLNSYAAGSMTQLSKISPGYSGNVEYSSSLNRILYNEAGISSTEIRAFTLTGNTIAGAEITSGSSYGGSLGLLSSDGLSFYYAQKELNAADLTKAIATFSENITAAGPTVAFGSTHYYDAATGAVLGAIPFTPLTWTVDANGRDAWAVQQSGSSATLHHFVIAQSRLWKTAGGGSWADATRWNPASLPDGMDNTADLSQVTLTSDATVTLDGDHTIGHLITGELGASKNWTVAPGTGGVLTLQVTGGIPNITVTNQTTRIAAPIAGTQGLLKDGSGTLILGAINTYTGGTTIAAGTLAIGADNNIGSGSLAIGAGTFRATGNITSARSIDLQNAASAIQVDAGMTYAASAGGTVSGTGGLTKTGTGTLDLTAGAVTYTGATTVSAGILDVNSFASPAQVTVASGAAMNVGGANLVLGPLANSGNVNFTNATGTVTVGTLSGTGMTTFAAGASIPTLSGGVVNVAGAASITTAGAGTANLSGATASIGTLNNTTVNLAGTALSVSAGTQTAGGVAGTGSLSKTGTGTLTLGADNTYTGGTTVAAGTLQIGNGGTTGSIVGNIANDGAVAFNRSDVYTFGGVISGAGSLRKSGSGTLTLTNTNTYTGGTTIAAGTLQLGDGTLAGAVSGDITNNGALIFATPTSGQSITGAISGSGRITKVGPGTLVMTGANTNAGGTTISAGTLQIGDGGTTGSITGNVIDDSALVFKRSDNVSFAGTITGAGRIEQAGTGTLTLATNVSNALVATSGRVVVGATSTFTGDLTTAQAGRVDNGGGTLHIAKLDNGGILSGTNDLTGSFLNRATGDIRLAAGQSMFVQSSLPGTNAGLLEALGNASSQATFETNGPFTNASGGSGMIAARYATLRFDAGLTNQGALSMNYGLTDVFGKVNNLTGGAITIAGGGGATFYDDIVQNGSLVVSAAGGTRSSAVFLGSFSGSGGFTGGGDVFILGDLRPGNSPAEVTYDGNVYLSPSTQLVMELGGERSGSQDKMDVTGFLGLDGGLSVVLYDGFVPSLGDHFDLFDASSVTGRFDSTTLPDLPEGLAWDTTNLYSSGTIGVTPEPATISLLALAGAAMLGRRKRRV